MSPSSCLTLDLVQYLCEAFRRLAVEVAGLELVGQQLQHVGGVAGELIEQPEFSDDLVACRFEVVPDQRLQGSFFIFPVNRPRKAGGHAVQRRIGEDGLFAKKRKTLMFNGYEAQVGQLYAGMDLKKFY